MLGWFFSSHPVFVSFPYLNEMTDRSPVFEKEIGGNQEVSLNYCCFVNFRNRNLFALFVFRMSGAKISKRKINQTKKKKLNAHPVTPKKNYITKSMDCFFSGSCCVSIYNLKTYE
jgi:hypothetical protein